MEEELEGALEHETKEELSLEVEMVRKIIEHIDLYTSDILTNFLCTTNHQESRSPPNQ